MHTRNRGDDFLDDPIDEILLVRIATEIGEGHNGNRRLVQGRQRTTLLHSLRDQVGRLPVVYLLDPRNEPKSAARTSADQPLFPSIIADGSSCRIDPAGEG